MSNFIAPYWEYPATVWCAHCHEPITFTWSSSAVGHHIYHGRCWSERKRNNKKEEQ